MSFSERLSEHLRVMTALQRYRSDIAYISSRMQLMLEEGGRLFVCGNGGSAADAQHFVAELVVRFREDSHIPPLPAMSLMTDPSVITAAANDLGWVS